MLSFGIQFGQGFDQTTVIKVMQAVPVDFDYDLLVIGSNPGGVACAREARQANKKTAIITWKIYSPAEQEGYDEDLKELEHALGIEQVASGGRSSFSNSLKETASELKSSMKKHPGEPKMSIAQRRRSLVSNKSATDRKVRANRMDLKNEFFKRGEQCRKLMHNATVLGRLVEDARKSGWRLGGSSHPVTLNWHKMSEEVMDYVMESNAKLVTMLNDEHVEVLEGSAVLENSHTVRLIKPDETESIITAEIICLALPSECVLPKDVSGAMKYGITSDDFVRLALPPGKTLVVGGLAESMECAGILAGCNFPVTVVSRSKILDAYDVEISHMIVENLKDNGVKFVEHTSLTGIELNDNGKLLTKFKRRRISDSSAQSEVEFNEFDTVVFAIGSKVQFNVFSASFDVERDQGTQRILVNEKEETSVPNIFAVGDGLANRPGGVAVAELAGKLLGRRLFHNKSELVDYAFIPRVMHTPIEYAFVGISESSAVVRLGSECVEVYYGYFKPLDFIIPARKESCFAKIIVLKLNDAIMGVHIFGPEAGEIIQGFAAALRSGLTMSQLRSVVGVTATKAHEILKLELRTHSTAKEN